MRGNDLISRRAGTRPPTSKRVAKVLYLVLLSISPGLRYGWNSCCRPSFAEISLRSCVTYTRKPSTLLLINYRLCAPVGGEGEENSSGET